MKNILFATLLAVVLAHQTIHERMHATHVIDDLEHETISNITPIENDDPMHKYTKMMDTFLGLKDKQLLGCRKSDTHEFLAFSFQNSGRIGHNGVNSIELTKYEDDCYESTQVTYKYNSLLRRVTLTFTPGPKKQSGHCSEFYLVGTTLNYNYITINDGKPHTVHFNLVTDKQLSAFNNAGAYVFRTCDNLDNWMGDFLMTLELFFGGLSSNPHWGPVFGSKPAPWMVRSNVEFIEKATGYRWQERPDVFVDLSEDEVNSGDFLVITRFDGLDQLIEWGTGSHSGHSAVVFKMDGETYVVESQDAWYWPKGNIQRNTWKEWKQYAINAGFNVAVLPINAENRAKWNQEAAEEWFKYMEGFPYGYHNFIFGWLDTAKDNLPPALSIELATYVFSFLEKILPSVATQFVGEGLNKRLGTVGLSIPEITIEAAKRGIELGDLYAMVEKDEWIYSDGPSQVCSSFVAGLYKAAGLFDGMDVQATEFTPKDVYQLKIFDSDFVVPEKCKVNDPDLPFCQIMGTHRFELEGYNTISPYAHMNEHCPSMAPDYERPDGC